MLQHRISVVCSIVSPFESRTSGVTVEFAYLQLNRLKTGKLYNHVAINMIQGCADGVPN